MQTLLQAIKTKEQLHNFVEREVELKINHVFNLAHAVLETKSGDITPEQVMLLDDLREQLTNLITEQAWQNK